MRAGPLERCSSSSGVQTGTADFLVVREFGETASYEQKLALVRCLFKVSATDGRIGVDEEAEIHRIANQLRILPEDLTALRLAHRSHLPGLGGRGSTGSR